MFNGIMTPDPVILPVLALVIWTLVMQGWMALTRLPAMSSAGLDPQAATTQGLWQWHD